MLRLLQILNYESGDGRSPDHSHHKDICLEAGVDYERENDMTSQPIRKKKAISDFLTILSLGMLKCPQSLQTAACQGQC